MQQSKLSALSSLDECWKWKSQVLFFSVLSSYNMGFKFGAQQVVPAWDDGVPQGWNSIRLPASSPSNKMSCLIICPDLCFCITDIKVTSGESGLSKCLCIEGRDLYVQYKISCWCGKIQATLYWDGSWWQSVTQCVQHSLGFACGLCRGQCAGVADREWFCCEVLNSCF